MPIIRNIRQSILPFVVLAVLPLLLLWRVVLLHEAFLPADLLKDIAPWRTGAVAAVPWNPLMWDGIAQFYPWRLFAAVTEQHGYLPLWNPHEFCGTPFMANAQSAIFYPPNVLFAILPVTAAFGASVLLHLLLTGIFLYAFLRRALNLRRTAALVGAITWQLCTWQVSWLALPTFLCVSTWIPAALLCIDRLARRPSATSAAGLGVTLGLMVLAGHLQVCLYGFLLIGAYGIFRVPCAMPIASDAQTVLGAMPVALDWHAVTSYRLRILQRLVIAVAIASLLGLAQMLPSLELSHVSHRAGGHASWLNYQYYVDLAVPAYQLATLVLPDVYGNPTQGTYWVFNNYAENACYIGIVGLLLCIVGVIASWRRSGETRFFAMAAVLALLLACGTKLNAALYFGIPGFAQSGSPGRILVLWSLCGAVLAGVGAETVLSLGQKRLKPTLGGALLLIIALTAGCLASLAYLLNQVGRLSILASNLRNEPNLWREPTALLLVFGICVWQYRRGKLNAKPMSAILVALVAIDMLATGIGYNRSTAPSNVYPATPMISYLQAHAGMDRVMPVNSHWSLDAARPPFAVLPPNAATVYGLYDTQGYDSLFPGQYMVFAAKVNADWRSPAPAENGNIVFTRGLSSPAAMELAPKYVASLGELPTSIAAPGLVEILRDGYVRLYENQNARPRYEIAESGASAVARSDAPTRLTIDMPVPLGKTESLIIRDQWYPGWRATVNGRPVNIDENPFVFRTIRGISGNKNGTATLDMRYQPGTVYVGLFCLMLGWSFAVALLACAYARQFAGRDARATSR